MPRIDKSCVSCRETGRFRRVNEKYICDLCYVKDEYKYISKTTVLKKYHLIQKDIDSVNFKLVTNPYYSCASKMILYKLTDILNVFNQKYNYPPDIESHIEKLNKEKEEEKENKRVRKELKAKKLANKVV